MIKSSEKDSRKKLAAVICICLVVFLVSVILGNVFYETNDDEGLNLIAVGGYGDAVSSYLVFINIVYSLLLKGLFSIVPGVNWYVWVLLILDLAGTLAICAVGSKKLSITGCIAFTLAVNLLFSTDLYNAVQYTKSAMWYGAAGACLIADAYLEHNKMRSWSTLWGTVFFAFSYLVRSLCSYIAALALFCVIGIETLAEWIKEKKLKIRSEAVISVILVAAVIGAFGIAQKIGYGSDEWKQYFRIYDARQELLDYGLPDYSANSKEFSEIGVSRISYDMLEKWIFNDPDYFSVEKMEQIVAIKQAAPRYRIDGYILGQMILNIERAFTRFYIPFAFVGLGIIALLLRKWKALGLWGALAVCIFLEYWHLCCVNRVVYRVVFGVWAVPVCVLFAYIAMNTEKEIKWLSGALCVALGILTCVFVIRNAVNFTSAKNGSVTDNAKAATEQFIDAINEREDGFYLGDTDTFLTMIRGTPFRVDSDYAGFYRNFAFIGGWTVTSPIGDYYLKERGIDNAMQALFKRDDVFLVDNSGSEMLILHYLQEVYDPKITMVQVDEICGFRVFKFTAGG